MSHPNFQMFGHEMGMAMNISVRPNSAVTMFPNGTKSGNCKLLLINPAEVSPNRSWLPQPQLANYKLHEDYFSLTWAVLESSTQYGINNNSLISGKHAWIFQLLQPEGDRKGKFTNKGKILIAW